MRSRGAVAVLATAPAAPPAKNILQLGSQATNTLACMTRTPCIGRYYIPEGARHASLTVVESHLELSHSWLNEDVLGCCTCAPIVAASYVEGRPKVLGEATRGLGLVRLVQGFEGVQSARC
jgi:hypothetical protein